MKTLGFCSTENYASKTVHEGFKSNIKLVENFESFLKSQRSLKLELCIRRYEFSKFEGCLPLLFKINFWWNRQMVCRLQYCACFELKSAFHLMTLNSVKLANGLPTFWYIVHSKLLQWTENFETKFSNFKLLFDLQNLRIWASLQHKSCRSMSKISNELWITWKRGYIRKILIF